MSSRPGFRKELMDLINSYSLENKSDTPDFVLADYLIRCLANFDETMEARGTWYGYTKSSIINIDEPDPSKPI